MDQPSQKKTNNNFADSIFLSFINNWGFQNISSNILGTPAYKRKVRKQIASKTRMQMSAFSQLNSLDHTTKQELKSRLRQKLKLLNIETVRWQKLRMTLFVNIYWGGLFLGMIISLLMTIYGLANHGISIFIMLSLIIISMFFAMILGGIGMAFGIVVSEIFRLINKKSSQFFLLFVILTTIFFYGFLLREFGNQLSILSKSTSLQDTQVIISALYGATIWLIAIFSVLTLNIFLDIFHTRTLSNQMPDALIINSLLTIVITVEKRSNEWGDLDFKKKILDLLEEAAMYMSRNLPNCLKSGDIITDIWFKETTNQISASLRSLKKWILRPKNDTKVHFLQKINSSLVCAIRGDWDKWEGIKPIETSRPERLKIFLSFIRNIFTAFIPLIFFAVIQQTPLALSGALSDYLLFGTLIWAIVTTLSILDPSFGTKINILKDINEIIPFKSNKN